MQRFKRTTVVSVLLVIAMAFSATGVFADEGTILLTGGSNTLESSSSFAFTAKTLVGTAFSSVDTNAAWTMVDARGSGAGWSISVLATSITGLKLNDNVTAVTLLPVSSAIPDSTQFGLLMLIDPADVVAMSVAAGSTSKDDLTYSANTAAVLYATTTAAKVLAAGVDKGMGGYDINPTFTLYMPAGTYAGSAVLGLTVAKSDLP